MAVRRTPSYDLYDKGEKDLGGFEMPVDDGGGGSLKDFFVKEPGVGGADGDLLSGVGDEDESGPVGNRTTGRELFAENEGLTPGPKSPGMGTPGLPLGMTIQDQGAAFGNAPATMDTPMMSQQPNPVAGQLPNPTMVPPPSQVATTRRAASPGAASALFADDSSGSPLFGRAGGLQEGGIAPFGGDEGGRPSPTKMMIQLLRQMRQGG